MINNKFDLNNINCVKDIKPETAANYSGGASLGIVAFGTTKPNSENSEGRKFVFLGRADQDSNGTSKISQGAFLFPLTDKQEAIR